MGKYKDVDKTKISDAILPPTAARIKRTNTETGESAVGVGRTYNEARKKAQEKLDKGQGEKK